MEIIKLFGCYVGNPQKNLQEYSTNDKYSRPSDARTLMVCLPGLFLTHSLVPWKKSHSYPIVVDFG